MKLDNKSEKIILEVLESYRDTQIASEGVRNNLAGYIHSKLSEHFHLFRKNERIVRNEKDKK